MQNTDEKSLDFVLRTNALFKKYKGKYALNGANINIRKGDIYGFVGENGSGKTTVIRVISGLIFPENGEFELFGISSKSDKIIEARKRIGAIVESPSIYLGMSAYDNLKMQCTIIGCGNDDDIRRVLKEVGLFELYSDKKKAGNFSLGMRQRLGIAMCLLGDPEFIILDEPMNGLDPAGIVEIRELILKLNREKGITFMISSHILTELALVATRYGIISKGKILKEISADELKNECRNSTVIETDQLSELLAICERRFKKEDFLPVHSGVKIYGDISLNELLSELILSKITIKKINSSESSIEDYYLSLLGGTRHA